jgi:hypothetical protein
LVNPIDYKDTIFIKIFFGVIHPPDLKQKDNVKIEWFQVKRQGASRRVLKVVRPAKDVKGETLFFVRCQKSLEAYPSS